MGRTVARLLGAALLAWTCASHAADAGGDKAAQRKALQEAAVRYNHNREDCSKLRGFERKACYADARAAYRKDEANAVADFRNTPRARMDAEVLAANADLSAARIHCADKTADLREACLRDAKEAQRKAVAEAVRKERAALASAPHAKAESDAPGATARKAP